MPVVSEYQRFFASTYGRFNTADPYQASAGAGDPGSWNRYAYVTGDPINLLDPRGLFGCSPSACGPGPSGGGSGTGKDDGEILDRGGDDGDGPADEGYRPPTPQEFAYGIASSIASKVKNKLITDCQGLAEFADKMAGQFTQGAFLEAFGVFVDQGDPPVQLANSMGLTMAGNSHPVIMLPQGTGASGYLPEYQDSLDKLNLDQTHHFAAFFELGYSGGAVLGAAAAVKKDMYPWNSGDINLGIMASALGAAVHSGAVKTSEVGGVIRNALCKH